MAGTDRLELGNGAHNDRDDAVELHDLHDVGDT